MSGTSEADLEQIRSVSSIFRSVARNFGEVDTRQFPRTQRSASSSATPKTHAEYGDALTAAPVAETPIPGRPTEIREPQ